MDKSVKSKIGWIIAAVFGLLFINGGTLYLFPGRFSIIAYALFLFIPLALAIVVIFTKFSLLFIKDIEEGSLAEASGLQPGDVVLELNRQHVNSFGILQRLADPLKPTDLALLLVNRQGNIMYIPIQGE